MSEEDQLRALTLEFHGRMIEIYETGKRECGYNATRFFQLVCESGGVEAAQQLLRKEGISEGLKILWEHGRLDISMENAVLEDRWRQLFTAGELETARSRLEDLGFRNV